MAIEDYEDDYKYVVIEGATCDHETDKAILVNIPEREDKLWIAKSQIHDDSDVFASGHEGLLIITRWLAEQKNLI